MIVQTRSHDSRLELVVGTGTRKSAANGDEIELRARVVNLDPLEQRLTLEMHAELWREGRLVGQKDRLLAETLYFRNEIQLLLANAWFAEVSVLTAYSGEEPTPNDTFLVFIAQELEAVAIPLPCVHHSRSSRV